jgi:hypothetical protein
MPGLLRGVARTAVVAGTASAVSGRVQRRQAERFADRDANIVARRQAAYQEVAHQPPTAQAAYTQPAPPPLTGDDVIERLKQLADLKTEGILTEEEFAAQKARILGG